MLCGHLAPLLSADLGVALSHHSTPLNHASACGARLGHAQRRARMWLSNAYGRLAHSGVFALHPSSPVPALKASWDSRCGSTHDHLSTNQRSAWFAAIGVGHVGIYALCMLISTCDGTLWSFHRIDSLLEVTC